MFTITRVLINTNHQLHNLRRHNRNLIPSVFNIIITITTIVSINIVVHALSVININPDTSAIYLAVLVIIIPP